MKLKKCLCLVLCAVMLFVLFACTTTPDTVPAPELQDGWCAVLVDGMPLGGGKIVGGVLKNHYPKGLRSPV